jgi:multidrug efflux pump subunit AcrB
MSSYSAEGISNITIEFEPEVDVDSALQKVRDKVDQAKPDLPVEADDPTLREVNFAEFPIMFLNLKGEVGLPIITKLAEDLEDELEAVRGVLDVKVIGGVEREIQIIVDPDLASEYGVSMADLLQLAQVENVNTPAGSLELGEGKYLVRVPGEFKSAAEIEDLVVKMSPDGGVVYMRDIAEIRDDFKDIETISRLDGTQAITLTVTKRAGESIIAISDAVREVIGTFEKRLLGGMSVEITMDQSEDIRDMVAELENSILSGLILVLVVIFLFLGFTNAVFVSLAIPVSMLITFACLSFMGVTLNMVVLFSLMLALGMLVDNGIVVVENIFRHVQNGMPPIQAAKQGAAEVAWPIAASTMTTVAAFAPMFFWPGIWGEFMKYLPLTVTCCLLGSLFVGLIVNPALASIFMRRRARLVEREAHRHHWLMRGYAGFLRTVLNWRAPTVVLAFTSLVVIGMVFFAGATVEFEPSVEPRRANVDVDGPQGQNLEETNKLIARVEEITGKHREHLDYILANVGSRGVDQEGGDAGGESSIGRVTMDFPKLQNATVMPSALMAELRDSFDGIAGAEIRVEEEEEGPPSGPPINVEISGPDFTTLTEIAKDVAVVLRTVPDAVNVRDDYDEGKPEVKVVVDRQQALMTGLNTEFIGRTVQTAINGRKAGEYREGDEEYDVIVRFPRDFREDLANLEAMNLVNLEGAPVPFSAVAHLEHGSGVGFIKRLDRRRTVTVSADNINRPGAEVLKDAQEALQDFPLPSGYTVSFTGENEEMEEAQAFLFRAFVIALFLIALILITQFNSILQPLIIMSSVVLSLAGVFLGLWIFQMPFGVLMTGIGCISLAGVVVNNAIVLIDFINQRRADGIPTTEAIIEASVTRFRPVMLTAVTTILGLIPMALGVSFDFRNMDWIVGGESSQYWGPMATAIIFGLGFATILTLVVVPTLYSLFDSLSNAIAAAFQSGGKEEETALVK